MEDPSLFRPPSEQLPARAAVMVRSPADYVDIVRRLYSLSMVSFTTKPKIVNGLFGTPKADGLLRFLFDGRPANAAFVPSPRVSLPSPELLGRLEVPKGEKLLVGKSDLDNFYHRLRLPRWMWEYFALPPVRAADLGLEAQFGDVLIFPCCTTLPMGWSHSAFLAQAAHEFILDTRVRGMGSTSRITLSSDYRIDRPRHMVYIDDCGFFGLERHRSILLRMQADYDRVLSGVGLPPKPSKVVPPSSGGVEVIGVEVHGRHLTVGMAPSKLHSLISRTLGLLARGECSGHELSVLMGCWTWAILPRRPAFAIFSSVYKFIRAADRRIFSLWPSVTRELRLAIGLVPLLFADLGAKWSPTVIATDASSLGQGVVASTFPSSVVGDMALVMPPRDSSLVDRSLPHSALEGSRWRTVVSSPFRFPGHINDKELWAMTTGARWAFSSPKTFRSRLLLWCDSLVAVFAARKGRSSSFPLLRRLRRLSAVILAGGIDLRVAWIPTHCNPADEPSRNCFARRGVRGRGFEFDSTLGFPGEGPPTNILWEARVKPATAASYRKAVAEFVEWLDDVDASPSSSFELDMAMSSWFQELYLDNDGKGRSKASKALFGVILRLPHLRDKFPGARQALRGWEKLVPSQSYPPMPWGVALVVAARLWARLGPSFGVATILAFHCYLRVGELCNLRFRDVALPGDLRLAGSDDVVLRLPKTKTGPNKWATVRSPFVEALLLSFLKSRGPGHPEDFVFGFSSPRFRKEFKLACRDLGLGDVGFVPHSLRHGGATHDFNMGVPIEDILHLGRWASTKSARHYIQSGRASLLAIDIPSEVVAFASLILEDTEAFFSLSQSH